MTQVEQGATMSTQLILASLHKELNLSRIKKEKADVIAPSSGMELPRCDLWHWQARHWTSYAKCFAAAVCCTFIQIPP